MSATLEQPTVRSSTYRVLVLKPDGTVVDTRALFAADDDEAMALAKSMVRGHAVELWDDLRFIEHFPPEG
ncbi:hypothetical protein [Methylobacterium gnaphalii]|uniref:Uncharacterized protein n=1 Tax=Methylobacterium gnaphalii TaxID=1010610 RepID=A0A512JM98_9HYPH|nr:hypothetical protein [Methylobacterium gnaphalii]GEP11096.1 hypothetical protein MGN01_29410 [Methylobacterium gnaphalii]GJD67091.1 hypothetical protein MMMDOFMJ_0004 [Methylobacterium gnaphalii]GLS50374.1 hypothetical protein GCM10007885_32260 [Methylobacterium gnaphalii]